MDAPIIEFPRGLSEGVERSRRPQENALQPDGEGLDGFCCSARLGVDFDDMGGVSWAVILRKTGHRALLQLLDPFDFSLKPIADVDGETWIFGIEDIPLRAALEGVGVGFDEVFKSIDPRIELAYLGRVVVFSLFDCLEQRFGDALQGVRVEVSTAVEDVSG